MSLSSLSFPFRSLASGPWHLKHLSARIGLMARLNSTDFDTVVPAPSDPVAGPVTVAISEAEMPSASAQRQFRLGAKTPVTLRNPNHASLPFKCVSAANWPVQRIVEQGGI